MQRWLIEKQITEAISRFPKFSWKRNAEKGLWIIQGDLDICDNAGIYWDTFQIAIFLNEKYPNSIPSVFETSTKIPRIADRHISSIGQCCLDVEHKLLWMASRGINLSDFIATKVYPFFANQIYFENMNRFAGEEYSHRFAGIEEFYKDDLKISNSEIAIKIINSILSNTLPERNDLCLCGQNKKFKKCHLESVEFLREVGADQLKKDLEDFKNKVIMNDITEITTIT